MNTPNQPHTHQAPSGMRADPHPNDADPNDHPIAARDLYPPDAYSQSQRARNNHDNGSPHVIVHATCQQCARTGIYYGHINRAPDPTAWTCDRCN